LKTKSKTSKYSFYLPFCFSYNLVICCIGRPHPFSFLLPLLFTYRNEISSAYPSIIDHRRPFISKNTSVSSPETWIDRIWFDQFYCQYLLGRQARYAYPKSLWSNIRIGTYGQFPVFDILLQDDRFRKSILWQYQPSYSCRTECPCQEIDTSSTCTKS